MGRLNDAKYHVNKAQQILATSGVMARFSWVSSYCAYRAGDVVIRQNRVQKLCMVIPHRFHDELAYTHPVKSHNSR